MSEPAFTPPPWDVRCHWGTFIYCIHDREGKPVAAKENDANARLIAAAPRMYAELAMADALLRRIEDWFLESKRRPRPEWFRDVQDRIAGASGALHLATAAR